MQDFIVKQFWFCNMVMKKVQFVGCSDGEDSSSSDEEQEDKVGVIVGQGRLRLLVIVMVVIFKVI